MLEHSGKVFCFNQSSSLDASSIQPKYNDSLVSVFLCFRLTGIYYNSFFDKYELCLLEKEHKVYFCGICTYLRLGSIVSCNAKHFFYETKTLTIKFPPRQIVKSVLSHSGLELHHNFTQNSNKTSTLTSLFFSNAERRVSQAPAR